MGLHLRHTARVGPLRVNFSKSGLTVSTGIRWLRIRRWPRGAWVHMGKAGLSYRQSPDAPARSGRAKSKRTGRMRSPSRGAPAIPPDSIDLTQTIDGGSVLQLTDGSPEALLEEVRRRHALPRLGAWAAAGAVLVFLMTWGAHVGSVALGLVLTGAVVIVAWGLTRDAVHRTIVVGYDLDSAAADRFEALLDAMAGLDEVDGLWHVPLVTRVLDGKSHAGASGVVQRKAIRPDLGQPAVIRTNLDVPTLAVGRRRLYFFPDRLLVFDGDRVAAVGYGDLRVEIGTLQCVEEGPLPADAETVPRTSLGPNPIAQGPRSDRDSPVVIYETIRFRSAPGLNELLHASRAGVGAPIAEALGALAGLSHPAEPDADEPEAPPPAEARRQSTGPTPTVAPGGPDRSRVSETSSSLKRGAAARAIAEHAAGWEYRAFAHALIDVMAHPPAVVLPAMPGAFAVGMQVIDWAKTQLEHVRQACGSVIKLANVDLPAAVGASGAAADPDRILEVAWQLGRQGAWARQWAAAVKATDVPKRYVALRDELARTLDQPRSALAAFGPDLLKTVDAALKAPGGSPARPLPLTLAVTLQNQEALKEAFKTAMR